MTPLSHLSCSTRMTSCSHCRRPWSKVMASKRQAGVNPRKNRRVRVGKCHFAVRISLICFCRVMLAAAVPCVAFERARTSTKMSVPWSRSTRSISPLGQASCRASRVKPARSRCRQARCSKLSPLDCLAERLAGGQGEGGCVFLFIRRLWLLIARSCAACACSKIWKWQVVN